MEPISIAKLTYFAGLGRKPERQTHQRYLAEGQKLCAEALAAGLRPQALLLTKEVAEQNPSWFALADEVYTLSPAQLARVSTQQAPDGAVAVLPMPAVPQPLPVVGPAFVLYDIADPGNLGTLLRTADWYGFRAIYASPDTVEATNPKVVRAAMGASFRVPVYAVPNMEAFVAIHAARIIATYVSGASGQQMPPDRDWLLLGSESHGLPQHWPTAYNLYSYTLERGPKGMGESLNVAITGAILADRLIGARPSGC
jgi:RNA methyltransferase, TrmH family